jgi:hypothetical protein
VSVDSGFDDLQKTVDADVVALREARRRRDVFVDALNDEADVENAWASGSLARRTHKDPIHDVDVVAVFSAEDHPDWGKPGESGEGALEHTRSRLKELLGSGGTDGVEIRLTRLENHSVKCFLDDPDDPNAFTVDVAPALPRVGSGTWVPERKSEKWIESDPEYLIKRVATRQEEWDEFVRLVRVLKRWNADHGNHMKSLVVEVLALDHLPVAPRPDALKSFFTAASVAVLSAVVDPAGLCGEIQPDLDPSAASAALSTASDDAWRAVDAAAGDDERRAMCLWREVFGEIFPEPLDGCSDRSGVAALGPLLVRPRPVRDAPQG